jgi:hypothetical protein
LPFARKEAVDRVGSARRRSLPSDHRAAFRLLDQADRVGERGGVALMIRQCIALMVIAFLAGTAFADGTVSPCVNALEQVAALETSLPVYKLTGSDSRQYIDDADRLAEIARLQKIIGTSCSAANSKARQSEESAAARLHIARSVGCTDERDKLFRMGQKDSRDDVAQQRKLVADECPTVPMANVWLVARLPAQL